MIVMECFFRSKPFDDEGKPIRGYRQRMMHEWKKHGVFEINEQRLCDQARAIRKNGWLSDLELENIRRMIETESHIANESTQYVEENQTEEDMIRQNKENEEIGNEADERLNNVAANVEALDEETHHIIDKLNDIITSNRNTDGISFKKIDVKILKQTTAKVNRVIELIETKNITQTNNLIKAAGVWVADQLGLKKYKGGKKKDPWWKRRIEGDIRHLREDINILERVKKDQIGTRKEGKAKLIVEKYRVKRKGLTTVIEELKQRILAKAAKIARYEQRIHQYRINRLFKVDQKRVYNEFNGQMGNIRGDMPNTEEIRTFWSGIWSVEKEHNKKADWLSDLKKEMVKLEQQNLVISEEKVKKLCSKIPNWKAPGHDGVQGFWIKRLDKLHGRIATQLNEILEGTKEIPSWMTYGRTVLCQKDIAKGNSVENFRPITCLPLMWKLLTGIVAEDIYCFMENENLFPEEQKGCRRKSRGTKDQLLIDKAVLKDCRKRRTNLAMAWIDYRKAYDFVPHSWIIECLDMLGIAENIRKFLESSMKNWKLRLASNGLDLCEIDVNRGIFQGDSLSPLIFVICMIPLSFLLRKVKASYEWGRKEFTLNHLLFMDDLKLFGKSDEQIDSLVQTVFRFSEDIGMEFGLKKCGVVTLKKGKLVKFDGIYLPNHEIMKEVDEKGYTYLGILELDQIKEHIMKNKVTAEYKRRLRLILKSKLNGKNKMQAINTWAVALLRYGAGIINWKVAELKKIDRTTRKTLTMYGAFHPKSDIDRLYLKRKHGGRGLISIETCVRSEENNLGLYVRESNEMLLKGVKKVGIINTENLTDRKDFKKNSQNEFRDRWQGKKMYGQFAREMPEEIDKDLSWQWLVQCDLKVQTEATICAAQEQALRTNYIKNKIDKTSENPLCRMCREKGETVQHIICECKKLAQREYKRRHDTVAKLVHWTLCEKYNLERTERWYEHCPNGIVENDDVKLIWDINIQCDNIIEARRPDLILVDKKGKSCVIVDIAVPGDCRVREKELEKIEKYQNLKIELKRLWSLKKVEIVPVVVGALGCISKGFSRWMDILGIKLSIGMVQKSVLLGTARILRKVLDM